VKEEQSDEINTRSSFSEDVDMMDGEQEVEDNGEELFTFDSVGVNNEFLCSGHDWDEGFQDTLVNVRDGEEFMFDESSVNGFEDLENYDGDVQSDTMADMLLPDLDEEYDNNVREEEDDEFSEVLEEDLCDIPTTNARKVAPVIESKGRKHRFGLHVLLNEHGSLLVRRSNHLKPSRAAKGFLERIVATSKGQCIPLLYPEAMLFPSIFWNQRQDGSYDGAIPVGLWSSDGNANAHGFAGIGKHMRCRLKNTSLLCSTDPKYIYFAFDSVNNLMGGGSDNRLVLKRGFEHMLGPGKVLGENNDSLLSSDMVDSRRNVQKLAALVRDKEPTYFYTHTCNQTEHFGIAPLRKALMKKLYDILMDHKMSDQDCKELSLSYHNMMSLQIIRTWFKVGKMYMNYIVTSPEKPLGTIERFWWRWEYQDANGNLPHIHCLLWTKESKHDPNDLQELQHRIRCSLNTFVSYEEAKGYIGEGLLHGPWMEAVSDVWDGVMSKLRHCCQAAGYRCMRRVGPKDGDLQCRSIDYYKQNPYPADYGYKEINPQHKTATMELLVKLGLFDKKGHYLDFHLRSGRYVYPAVEGEHMSPCNPRLFIAHGSSDNLVITDTYFSCRYLAKYVQGIDENCKVTLKAGKQRNSMFLQEEYVPNTKITTGKIMQEEREKKRKQNPWYSGRTLCLPEAVGLLLQEQQVFTNATFVTIPTVPLEQRPAHEKVSATSWCQDIRQESLEQVRRGVPIGEGNRNFLGRRIREEMNMPADRLFTPMEQIIIQDALSSPLSLDAITLFSCRPPELRFVDSPIDYFRYFRRMPHRPCNKATKETTTEALLNQDLMRCGWVDGLDCQIVVRPQSIAKVLQLPKCTAEVQHLFELLNFIQHGVVVNGNRYLNWSQQELRDTYSKFIDQKVDSKALLPFPLFNVVKPTQTNRFLIHLLLSMGRFNNEGDLFKGQKMADYFFNAGLIGDGDNVTEEDVLNLTKRFIMEQLLYVPGGTMMFDRYCLAAYDAIKAALMDDSIASNDVPSYLYTSLVEEANKSALRFHNEVRENLASAMSNLPNVPLKDELLQASKQIPLDWSPNI
jgi:hypothetical protein